MAIVYDLTTLVFGSALKLHVKRKKPQVDLHISHKTRSTA